MVQKIYTVPATILKVKKNNWTSTLTCHCLEHIQSVNTLANIKAGLHEQLFAQNLVGTISFCVRINCDCVCAVGTGST